MWQAMMMGSGCDGWRFGSAMSLEFGRECVCLASFVMKLWSAPFL